MLEMYRALAAEAPRELTCVAALRLAPPAPWLAKEVHGKPIVALFVCYSGPLDEGERLVAPIKAFGSPVGDVRAAAAVRLAADAARRDAAEGAPLLLEVGVPARRSSPALFTGAIAHAAADRVAALGDPDLPARRRRQRAARGPLRRRQPRRRRASSTSPAHGSTPTTTPRTSTGRATAWSDLRQFSTGGTYINFLTEDEGDDRTRAAFRGTTPGWPGSRRRGTRRTCSAPTRTFRPPWGQTMV